MWWIVIPRGMPADHGVTLALLANLNVCNLEIISTAKAMSQQPRATVASKLTVRNHCSQSQVSVSLGSLTLHSDLLCCLHGYVRVHTTPVVFI